jgi:hypothetical protein
LAALVYSLAYRPGNPPIDVSEISTVMPKASQIGSSFLTGGRA